MEKYTVKVWEDGTKEWYQNGQLHRLDGHAVEWGNGTKMWYVNGQLHRLDGPAVEYSDGTKKWFIDGEELTEKEFIKHTSQVELTMDQIAKQFNIPVELLKIKKG